MDSSEHAVAENHRLRRTMRDLVALSTLPAVWTGLDPDGIVRSLADVLLSTLSLDLLYVRLADVTGEAVIEVVRSKHRLDPAQSEAARTTLADLVKTGHPEPPSTIPDPFKPGILHLAVTRFGVSGDQGILVTGSTNADFPTERDRLLLGVGANQTAIVVQRKRAEQELREAERRFKAVFNQQFQFMVIVAADGTVLEANNTCFLATGVQTEEVLGRPIWETPWWNRLPVMQQWWKDQVNEVVRCGGPVAGEVDYSLADGSLRHADAVLTGLKDDNGRIVSIIIEGRDNTDRRRQEQALRDSEERFRNLADNIPQLAWIADAGTYGQVHWFNQNWFEYTGTTLEEMKGWGWHAVHHPDHADRVIQRFSHHVQAGLDWEDTFPLRGKDGQYRWFLSRMKCIRDESGNVVRIFGTNTDISEQREMADALRQSADAMAEADRRKDEFLATLAHELRNPLAPVRNALQLLRIKGPAEPELQWTRDVIDRQVQRMTRLIDDLMDVSRISRNKLELRKEVVRLAKVVQGAVETSRPLMEEMGHELHATLPPEPILLDADVARLEQVFLNLLNNAAKYTEKGGHIRLSAERQGSDVVVVVKDTGIGIPASNLRTIFEMFSQVEGALTRSQGGLGIGLCLVKRLVEMHGGTIEAHSAGPGKGSEFVVRLPIFVARRHTSQSEPQDSTIPTSKLRILVVDDNRDAVTSLAMLLQLMGNTVRTAFDGEEAVQAAGEFRPHLILLDIGLPKMNGYEVCRCIREEPWGKDMTLIAVSGWGQDGDRQKSNEAGFDRHMVKPVDPQGLMKMLAGLHVAKR